MNYNQQAEKKRALINLINAEEEKKLSIRQLLMERDNNNTRQLTYGVFKSSLEKISPEISRDAVMAFYQDYQVPNSERLDYVRFLDQVDDLKKKKRDLNEHLEQIYHRHSSSEHTLMELFEQADRNRDGILDRKEFADALDKFGVRVYGETLDAFFMFLDSNSNNEISYREFNTYFTTYLKSMGSGVDELSKSSLRGISPKLFL
jgi:Ca2+-binding EF-hand superfamily protein